ncbi:MAG: PhoD-like phosphatase N-terminal domain-containing protein [Chloroflexota bacterium]
MSLFTHGVASGDPETDRVVIWTRVGAGHGGKPRPPSTSASQWRSEPAVRRSSQPPERRLRLPQATGVGARSRPSLPSLAGASRG